MGETLVYPYRPGRLYVNLTNSCGNSCTFCARSFGHMRLGPFDLTLSSEHGLDEYMAGIDHHVRDRGVPREFVFCGYGEPTVRIDILLELSRWIRDTYPAAIRLNTNGTAGLVHGFGILAELPSRVDRMNVSLNAPDERSYRRICRPRIRGDVWRHVVGFARFMTSRGVDVWCSAVGDALTMEELSALREFLHRLHIPLHLR